MHHNVTQGDSTDPKRSAVDLPRTRLTVSSTAGVWAVRVDTRRGLAVVADYASPGNLLARYHTVPLSVDIPYTRAFLSGETLITSRHTMFSEFPALLIDADLWESSGLDSSSPELVSVPIASQGVSIGAFGFASDPTQDWGPSDFGLLEALAALLGMWLTHPSSCVGTKLTGPLINEQDGSLQLSPGSTPCLISWHRTRQTTRSQRPSESRCRP